MGVAAPQGSSTGCTESGITHGIKVEAGGNQGGIKALGHGIMESASSEHQNQESHTESGIKVESFTDEPCYERFWLESGTTKPFAAKIQKGTRNMHISAANACAVFLFLDQRTSESHVTHSPPGPPAVPVRS